MNSMNDMNEIGNEMEGDSGEASGAGTESAVSSAPGSSDALSRLTMAERKIIYGKATSDKIVQLLHSVKGKPDAALAVSAMFVLKAMANEISGKVPPDAIQRFRDVLLGDLAELADAAGLDVGDEHIDGAKKIMDQTVQAARQQMAQRGGGQAQPPTPPGIPVAPAPAGDPRTGGLLGGAMAPSNQMGRMAG